ncbi:MAG: tRNA preQ1(34) S-adenosylmethionine ribosyltransferase-isomerase QueA [Gemmatimonadota bacterium]|nr:tRNA preQ1(34) S-adenosylmethionine ribosyltransferase-isomerase QueA [Gemmatimonadota bacterium]
MSETRGTRVWEYEYDLPPERIARYPATTRDESRMLVVPPGDGPFRHLRFRQITELVRSGDLLVVNESRVRPARLLGRKPTGAPAEIFLLGPAEGDDPRDWNALVRPGSKLKPGRTVEIAPELKVEIRDGAAGGGRIVRLHADGSVEAAIERHGHMPLPPYIDREDEPLDRERYQTVYARAPGSVAAPTAGLHFTDELLAALESMGVRRTAVTLDVGMGTFRPVDTDDPAEHEMHRERYTVPESAAAAVAETRQAGGRVWAVGTTVVRTLEAVSDARGGVAPGSGVTDLFIHPPFDFKVVDGLITNFHLPRSTLLMLVAALGGFERVMDAYRVAVAEGYRFYSYGDAMAILPRDEQP